MIQYLQRRNPNVPGIPFKLNPPEKRNLKYANDFWRALIVSHDISDVYTGKIINEENMSELGKIDIDHFIPWSYVACDEIWNLTPTFTSVNRSKNNNLPSFGKEIKSLSKQHFYAKEISKTNKALGDLYKKYKDNHLNNDEINRRLFISDLSELSYEIEMDQIIRPVYMSAINMGFREWKHNFESR